MGEGHESILKSFEKAMGGSAFHRLTGLLLTLVLPWSGRAFPGIGMLTGSSRGNWITLDLTSRASGASSTPACRLPGGTAPKRVTAIRTVSQRSSRPIGRGLISEDVGMDFASYDRFRADLFERAIPEGTQLAMS